MPKAFDESELLERVDNDWEFLAETVQMLSTDGPMLMNEMRRACAAGEAPALARAAHALKGMLSNFCAPTAQSSALVVETIGKSGELAAAQGAIDSAQSQLDALIGELSQYIATRPGADAT